jgi:hypothetical protein
MAWSWSHSQEAYCDARDNVGRKSREWLEVCYAEWWAAGSNDCGYVDGTAFDEGIYNVVLIEAKTLPDDVLADHIWDQMQEQATCDNGGWNAWCCPSGCHTVSFSPESEVTA